MHSCVDIRTQVDQLSGAWGGVEDDDSEEDEMATLEGVAIPAPAPQADDPDGPSAADISQRKIVEDMYAAGTITEVGLGHVVALHYYSSNVYQVH